ncbi:MULTISPECIES: LacI family DNA-binding transcriptional regulator [unclassified Bacillus (in: firmicutes)]|uniref:LacI family DNA-binding transcriptional regulator n=1 Tax=unclassified Bacillus (in: firmicutes) TaxID=185979 RepID=UPI0008E7EA93|nr:MULTISPECIES: LacI family DNA-binding transcriptional regulator [unclassified Bacillus (in: firmicutes)]SFB19963.1 transcriptional regulator, LacI family [Bacillus sp. UNCCL13]SFQ90794.1 transcriptional regulator, LacI family [Bacillus sp. cl95]
MTYTIKDVARNANVSIATVSRILNGQTGYSPKTKEKVLKVINELGYHPNAVARGLINKRTHTIGVLFPYLTGSLVTGLLRGIEKAASAQSSSVIVCHTESDADKTMKYLKLLNEKRVDGIIFTSEVLQEEYYDFIKKMNVPIVLLSTKSDDYPIPYIKVDDFDAAYTATQYLIQKGHKNIGMISGPKEDIIAGEPRVKGYMKALEDNYIKHNDKNVVYTVGFGFPEGKEGLASLLKQNPDITALFAASDEIAIGAISTAYQMGIKIPEELSIIGYDNTSLAEMSVPPLTTIAQPFSKMGEIAGNMLLNLLDGEGLPESRIVPHSVIERKSVKEK